jgi:PleD family two-component response regulator
MAGETRQLVLLDTSGNGVTITDAIVIQRDRDLSILKSRLASLVRRDARSREVVRRRETAMALGAAVPKVDPDETPHLLYLGDGSELFLALQGALKERGLAVTAALSNLTAQDYMASRRFAAAIVDLTPRSRDATAFIDWTSPEGAPAGTALFVLADAAAELSETQRAAMAQAAEVIFVDVPSERIAARIEKYARQYMASAPIVPQPGLTSKVADLNTGFFSRRFLESHIEKQIEDAAAYLQPLSLLTLKLTQAAPQDYRAMRLIADCVRPILRETDCPALMSADTIAVSLLATPYRGGVTIAERIGTAVARQGGALHDHLAWRVVERRSYHTAKTLLGAGLTGPFTRAYAA